MKRLVLAILIGLAVLTIASADPISKERIPEPLRPWIDWVLLGHEEELCPFFQGDAERRECAWPSRLVLDLGDRGGRFTQQWIVEHDQWVPLPGDAKNWPQEVRVDGRPAGVTAQQGAPTVRLPAGRHALGGAFEWDSLPSLLQVPVRTGLVGLAIHGRAVPFASRDEQGRLWLQKTPGGEQAEDRLEMTVSRKVTDDIPLVLTTRLDLQVSGKSREVVLGRPLAPGFIAMSLSSPLPARLDPDGGLRVQARPGRFVIEVKARHDGPVASLQPPPAGGNWPPQEVWVFEARPALRLIQVEGVQAVDPQQTTLPEDWKGLPTYLMLPGKTMTLTEKRRGDSDPAPDQLSLQRTIWLDFDGGGYTIHDAIAGTMRRGWRLEMPPPAQLGRVAIDGRDQFITRLGPGRAAGVELRQESVHLEADSRLERGASVLPAVGWDHDFTQVTAWLYLPPAWRLFSATGVDDVSATWISSWTLLDLFLVLIGAMSVARLWGRRWGALALVAFGLTWIEPGAPAWSPLAVLAFEALRRALPDGRIRKVVTLAHRLALVVLVCVAAPFLVQQVRAAIYPALEQTLYAGESVVGFARGGRAFPYSQQEAEGGGVAGTGMEDKDEISRSKMQALGYIGSNVPAGKLPESRPSAQIAAKLSLYAPDPKAVVQTGPGLPDWTWRTATLEWRGPVTSAQRLRLILIPPTLNRLLNLLRVALIALLALCLFGFGALSWPVAFLGRWGLRRGFVPALLAGALAAAATRPSLAAEIPPPDLLNDLRARLLSPPGCRPDCASSPRLALDARPAFLSARLEMDVAAATAVPLPGGADQWLPERVLVDGDAAAGLVRTPDGRLWLRLAPGTHQVLMEGALPDRDTVQIPLPLKPHRVTARAEGWRIEGLHEDGLAEDSLQLVQLRGRPRGPAGSLEPGALPPFVRIERELTLGLTWQVETRVVRVTPPGAAVLLEVPLLPGESVTTPDVRVQGGRALASLGPQVSQAGWTSTLAQAEAIKLRAPGAVSWVEVWLVAISPIWHAEAQGIPLINRPDQPGARMLEWRPWPGETVSLAVSRPEGLPGQTLTIDQSSLAFSPGLRATDATLDFTLRSSRGGQHMITLPDDVELQSVKINQAVLPIRQEGRVVTLPVVPGMQQIALSWRQGDGIRVLFRTSEVRLGAAIVNARTAIAMPADRWTLFLGGPRLGPAVLFWGLLTVSGLASLALGRVRLTPLRGRDWFLLSMGLTQAPLWIAIAIAGWLFALGWRRQKGAAASNLGFNLFQVLIVAATAAALSGLFWSITDGLLGLPEMQISGNGSSARDLRWYLDRAGDTLPRAWVVSLPLYFYRLAMLAWALWLAQALLRWVKWGWICFTEGGLWRPRARKAAVPRP